MSRGSRYLMDFMGVAYHWLNGRVTTADIEDLRYGMMKIQLSAETNAADALCTRQGLSSFSTLTNER